MRITASALGKSGRTRTTAHITVTHAGWRLRSPKTRQRPVSSSWIGYCRGAPIHHVPLQKHLTLFCLFLSLSLVVCYSGSLSLTRSCISIALNASIEWNHYPSPLTHSHDADVGVYEPPSRFASRPWTRQQCRPVLAGKSSYNPSPPIIERLLRNRQTIQVCTQQRLSS